MILQIMKKIRKVEKVKRPPACVSTSLPEEPLEYYGTHLDKDLSEDIYWKRLYNRMIAYFPPPDKALVMDLGCGPGYFAKILHSRGYRHYLGVDFSESCINAARERVPEFEFMLGSIYSKKVQEKFAEYNTFVLIEVLEHLTRDIRLIRSLPHKKRVVLSVPNTGGRGHVRMFSKDEGLRRRYASVINFRSTSMIYRGRGNAYWLVGYGIRK